jgi:putative ABC transport system permease protein
MKEFDLELAISTWKQSLRHTPSLLPDDLEELERHLRDHISDLEKQGLSRRDAYEQARREIGPYDMLDGEYGKVTWRRSAVWQRLRRDVPLHFSMLSSHIQMAARVARRQPFQTAASVVGLATGLTVAILAFLFVQHETSFDRFHTDAENVLRIVTRGDDIATSALLGPSLQTYFPQVETTTRVSQRWGVPLVTHEDTYSYEPGFVIADTGFFDVFSFDLLAGDRNSVLAAPLSVVITEKLAQKYFGTADVVGQRLRIKGPWDEHEFTVTGVAANPPSNTHLPFTMIASFSTRYITDPKPASLESWFYVGDITYVRVASGSDVQALRAGLGTFLKDVASERAARMDEEDIASYYTLQAITDIHLRSPVQQEPFPVSSERYVRLIAVIAFLVWLVSVVNVLHLTLGRTAARAREVGIRKVAGADGRHILVQSVVESALWVGLSLVVAGMGAAGSWPAFQALTGAQIGLFDGAILQTVVFVVVLTGAVLLVAAAYPAWLLARFRPVDVLNGVAVGRNRGFVRRILVTAQLALSLGLILGSGIVYQQMQHVQQQTRALQPDQILVVRANGAFSSESDDAFKEALAGHAGVQSVSAATYVPPLAPGPAMTFMKEPPAPGGELPPQVDVMSVDPAFAKTLSLDVLHGRDLQPEDSDRKDMLPVLINEAAVRAMEWEDPIGKQFGCCFSPAPQVVGVVEDFPFRSAHDVVGPVAIMTSRHSNNVLVRVESGQIPAVLEWIGDVWKEQVPGRPLEIEFLDERFAQAYATERRMLLAGVVMSGLALFIALLGVLASAQRSAMNRLREIGIRKVLGAGSLTILRLLTTEYVLLVAISGAIAFPVIHILGNAWLQDFAYRASLPIGSMLTGIACVLLLTWSVAAYHALRAARVNPITILREL